jgi:hypothetical protein
MNANPLFMKLNSVQKSASVYDSLSISGAGDICNPHYTRPCLYSIAFNGQTNALIYRAACSKPGKGLVYGSSIQHTTSFNVCMKLHVTEINHQER